MRRQAERISDLIGRVVGGALWSAEEGPAKTSRWASGPSECIAELSAEVDGIAAAATPAASVPLSSMSALRAGPSRLEQKVASSVWMEGQSMRRRCDGRERAELDFAGR